MLQQTFSEVYTKFKLHFYKKVFEKCGQRELTLTTVETFCMEIIHAMGNPTVNEFAGFVQISPPNAAYKVNSLIQKGYLEKVQSKDDRREYHIAPTKKYLEYYNVSYSYLSTVLERVQQRFPAEDVAKLEAMLLVISTELMPEIPLSVRYGVPPTEE